ncbi:hypothetical protein Droror1_Dr00009984, partial [Drosera rotundifolia]
ALVVVVEAGHTMCLVGVGFMKASSFAITTMEMEPRTRSDDARIDSFALSKEEVRKQQLLMAWVPIVVVLTIYVKTRMKKAAICDIRFSKLDFTNQFFDNSHRRGHQDLASC